MALEMAKWLVAWGRRYDAEWDGMYDMLQCLWNLSRSQYIDNRNHGVVPIVQAAVTLARDVADEDPIHGVRLTKYIGEFYLGGTLDLATYKLLTGDLYTYDFWYL